MNRPPRCFRLGLLCLLSAAMMTAGCVQAPDKPKPPTYQAESNRAVPPFMKGTLYEVTNLQNDHPFLVSGWGLVVNLDGTGGSKQTPNTVKAYMVKEMEKMGFGSKLIPAYADVPPEAVLADKNAAVVAVYGWLPPAAHKGQWFDIALKAEGLEVTSLARGMLYDTELTIDGADAMNPFHRVNVWATAYGPVFVNPAVALNFSPNPDGATRRSLRVGTVIGGGQVMNDRPLLLRLRQPDNRLSRGIEALINDVFHQDHVCTAYDQAYCQLWLPARYQDDWEHFAKLVQHVYLRGDDEAFARAKARDLVAAALKPDAPLQDISYCWEGLGRYALPELAPLLVDSPPDVRFAAARAAAYIGDPSGAAERALFDIAKTPQSQFQLAAVEVLGKIPNSRAVNELLRQLLDSDQTTVRIEAYKVLARAKDPAIRSRVIASARESSNQKFILDFVHSNGEPLIYATRSGVPRIAIFGQVPELALPVTFSALGNRLMIASKAVGRDVTIFYRDAQLKNAVQMSSPPDVADVVARLAGQIDDGTGQLDFTYAEILAILQGMSDQHKLQVATAYGQETPAAFMLQSAPQVRDAIDDAPLLDRGRPQTVDNPANLDAAPLLDRSHPRTAESAANPDAAPAAAPAALTAPGRQ